MTAASITSALSSQSVSRSIKRPIISVTDSRQSPATADALRLAVYGRGSGVTSLPECAAKMEMMRILSLYLCRRRSRVMFSYSSQNERDHMRRWSVIWTTGLLLRSAVGFGGVARRANHPHLNLNCNGGCGCSYYCCCCRQRVTSRHVTWHWEVGVATICWHWSIIDTTHTHTHSVCQCVGGGMSPHNSGQGTASCFDVDLVHWMTVAQTQNETAFAADNMATSSVHWGPQWLDVISIHSM